MPVDIYQVRWRVGPGGGACLLVLTQHRAGDGFFGVGWGGGALALSIAYVLNDNGSHVVEEVQVGDRSSHRAVHVALRARRGERFIIQGSRQYKRVSGIIGGEAAMSATRSPVTYDERVDLRNKTFNGCVQLRHTGGCVGNQSLDGRDFREDGLHLGLQA